MHSAKTMAWTYPIPLRPAAAKSAHTGSRESGRCAISHVALVAIQPYKDVKYPVVLLMIPSLVYVPNTKSPSAARSATTNVVGAYGVWSPGQR